MWSHRARVCGIFSGDLSEPGGKVMVLVMISDTSWLHSRILRNKEYTCSRGMLSKKRLISDFRKAFGFFRICFSIALRMDFFETPQVTAGGKYGSSTLSSSPSQIWNLFIRVLSFTTRIYFHFSGSESL